MDASVRKVRSPQANADVEADGFLAGQQVTGYGHNDTNNQWQIIPTKALPASGVGRVVKNEDVIQLLHVNTQTLLLTHDVASPHMRQIKNSRHGQRTTFLVTMIHSSSLS